MFIIDIFKVAAKCFWGIIGAYAKAIGKQILIAIGIAVVFFLIGRFG